MHGETEESECLETSYKNVEAIHGREIVGERHRFEVWEEFMST